MGLKYHGIETICFEPAVAELLPSQIEASIRESLTGMAITDAIAGHRNRQEYSEVSPRSIRQTFVSHRIPAGIRAREYGELERFRRT